MLHLKKILPKTNLISMPEIYRWIKILFCPPPKRQYSTGIRTYTSIEESRKKKKKKQNCVSMVLLFSQRMPRTFNGGNNSLFIIYCRNNWKATHLKKKNSPHFSSSMVNYCQQLNIYASESFICVFTYVYKHMNSFYITVLRSYGFFCYCIYEMIYLK